MSSCLDFYRTDKVETSMEYGCVISGYCILTGTFRWEAEAKAHMMAYDITLKNFTTIFDEEPIL